MLRAQPAILFLCFSASAIAVAALGPAASRLRWTMHMPAALATAAVIPANGRSVKTAEELFVHETTIAQVVATFGRPDLFTRQAFVSRTRGSKEDSPRGGTLLYRVAGGTDLLVWSGNLVAVHHAVLFDRHGKATLLFK